MLRSIWPSDLEFLRLTSCWDRLRRRVSTQQKPLRPIKGSLALISVSTQQKPLRPIKGSRALISAYYCYLL